MTTTMTSWDLFEDLRAAELPGVKAGDVEITFEDGLLTIQGERHFAHDSMPAGLLTATSRRGQRTDLLIVRTSS